MGDLIVAEEKIDRDHALASQQGSVETRDKSRARGEHESDVAARCGPGEIARQCAGGGGQLGKRAGAAFVTQGNRLGRTGGVVQKRLE